MNSMVKMATRTWRALLALFVVAALSGCVSTYVSNVGVSPGAAKVDRLAVLLSPGSFSTVNSAGFMGQRNLDRLAPNLQRRVPAVFSLNGVPTRWWNPGVALEPGEQLLVIAPTSATYSSQTGQTLVLRGSLRSSGSGRESWHADIRMATMGFGQFDDKVADDIASKLLQQLRAAKLLAGSEPIRLPPPTPPTLSASASKP